MKVLSTVAGFCFIFEQAEELDKTILDLSKMREKIKDSKIEYPLYYIITSSESSEAELLQDMCGEQENLETLEPLDNFFLTSDGNISKLKN